MSLPDLPGMASASVRAVESRWARVGDFFLRHQSTIRMIQWVLVFFYLLLVIVPALIPLPDHTHHLWNNLTLFAQFLFWGIWWPFVLISMVLVGRVWCGVFCPEGTLTEVASKYGLGKAIPRWVRWGGWPFVAFLGTTLYGQMISVYQYPKATLLILGGSTLGAVIVGFLYGKEKRVWCRYLCPVNGVFGLLAKLSPLHYQTNKADWAASRDDWRLIPAINCPTLQPLAALDEASGCHQCGRCSGYRDAISLKTRGYGQEVVASNPDRATRWELLLITFGMGGVAVGAFHWSASPWFVQIKQLVAEWLVAHDALWMLQNTLPWWILTDYPEQSDVFNLLDGSLLPLYIATTGVLLGLFQVVMLALATRCLGPWSASRCYQLSYALIPLVGTGVFLGLSSLTVSILRTEQIPLFWVSPLRALLLGGAALWSLWLFYRLMLRDIQYPGRKHLLGMLPAALSVASLVYAWYLLFWGWSS